MKYYQIKPKDVAYPEEGTLQHGLHTAQGVDNDNTGETNDPEMIPKWSGVKKNCPPHWRET